MTITLDITPAAAVAARITEQVAVCVREVGRVRGRHDAVRIIAAATPAQRRILHQLRAAPSYVPGDIAHQLATFDLLPLAQLFAPNGTGHWSTFMRHTTGMMLTATDHDLLTAVGADVEAVVAQLGDLYAYALQQGWEDAVGEALTTQSNAA